MSDPREENRWLAHQLRAAADLLESQGANPFRVGAYRRGAETLDGLAAGAREILDTEGPEGLRRLPHVGAGLSAAIGQMLSSGRWAMLERLRGEARGDEQFTVLPGVGPELARRIHDHLDVDSLETLELAAHDGRLECVPGIGARRAEGIRAALERVLRQRARSRERRPAAQPPVDLLLDVDREYRTRAAAGELPRIAPRRFNPEGRAWLPVLHAGRGEWHLTALFSNTARAHQLARTDDWVVLYFYDDHHHEGQSTVVTETHGELEGRRVVRGREVECAAFYRGLARGRRTARTG